MSHTNCHTFTGRGFDPLNPRPRDVRIEDIAHHLAMTCRFGGATPVFYSVAQHAIHVAKLVEELSGDPLWALHALHHDSAEAYLGDQRRPIKGKLHLHIDERGPVPFDDVEAVVAIAIVAGLQIPLMDKDHDCGASSMSLIADADNAVLAGEFRCLFPHSPESEAIQKMTMIQGWGMNRLDCWGPERAKLEFLMEHSRLMRLCKLMQANSKLEVK